MSMFIEMLFKNETTESHPKVFHATSCCKLQCCERHHTSVIHTPSSQEAVDSAQ